MSLVLRNILKYIPGFRSGKKIKMLIASIYYLFSLLMFISGFGTGLFYLAMPFLVFSFIDIFRHKKKSMTLKKALLNFVISLLIVTVAMAASPSVEPVDDSGKAPLQIVENTQEPTEEISDSNIDGTDKPTAVLPGGVTENPTDDPTKSPIEESTENPTQNPIIEPTDEPTENPTAEPSSNPVIKPTASPKNTDSKFEVHFIDVGQGDASLVLCDGESMLIDGGTSKSSSLIYTYLKNHGIDHLNYIVSTHPHEDHVGGLAGALNYATVGKAFSPVTTYDSRAFNSFVKYLNEQNVSITVPKPGNEFKLGSAAVKILGPVSTDSNANNNSIVLKITYGDTSFLFTGDAEREEEQDILAKGYDLNSTVLKVGHHGADTSTTYPFLREIMPGYAVISVGTNNQYGHPTDNALSRLRDADVKTYRTDMQGDIICTSNGKSVSFKVERNANIDTLASVSKPTASPTAKPTVSPSTKPTAEPTPKPTVKPTTKPEEPTDVRYILNTSTKKFHHPHCSSVKMMSDKNKQETAMTRDEVIGQGYDPCGRCNP